MMLLFGGCAASPPRHIFVLGSATDTRSADAVAQTDATVQVMTVAVPDYLDSTDILRRTGPNEVVASPSGRWCERVSVGLTDALTARLTMLLPHRTIITTELPHPATQLQVAVERFDVSPDGTCVLQARWDVLAPRGKSGSFAGRGTFGARAASGDDAALAAAMTQAINQLAARIAAALNGDIRWPETTR
jgi:uncharacterized lipoprotein YmbA